MIPFISIVIPTYNHAPFLARALQSVLDQVFTNWEAIVVDNHSQDTTDEVLKTFTDPRIRSFKIHNNGVIAASRNKGISEAKGEWIAFLDSDDWWTSDKLQCGIDTMDNDVDFIYHDMKVVGLNTSFFKRSVDRTRQVTKTPLIDLLINGNLITNSSVMVRKKLLEQVGLLDENPKMIGAEDFNTWLKIAQITNKFLYIPDSLGYYEFHDSGISRKDMSECYGQAVEMFLDKVNESEKNRISAHISYMKGRYYFIHKRFDQAIHEFRKSLKDGTTEIRAKSIYEIVQSFFMHYVY